MSSCLPNLYKEDGISAIRIPNFNGREYSTPRNKIRIKNQPQTDDIVLMPLNCDAGEKAENTLAHKKNRSFNIRLSKMRQPPRNTNNGAMLF